MIRRKTVLSSVELLMTNITIISFNITITIIIVNTSFTLLSSVGLLCCILYFDPRRIDLRWKRPENLKSKFKRMARMVKSAKKMVMVTKNLKLGM